MPKYENFFTSKPTETGWYWMQNMTVMNEPEIVFVRPVDLFDSKSELGYQRFGGSEVRSLKSVSADLMQWQKAEWE